MPKLEDCSQIIFFQTPLCHLFIGSKRVFKFFFDKIPQVRNDLWSFKIWYCHCSELVKVGASLDGTSENLLN